ncbi:15510_t:CDS:2, partial [Cetraspora pellucida]
NEQSDNEFEEFDNEEFDPNQILIYQATSIAESTSATEAFENLLVRSVSSMNTGSNIKRKKTEIEVIEDYKRKQKRLIEKNELIADEYQVIITKVLIDIEKYLSYYEKHLTDYSFPAPDYSLVEDAEKYSIWNHEL